MGNNTALESIIASLQEYKASEQPTAVEADPSDAVRSFFMKLGEKIDRIETPPAKSESAPQPESVEKAVHAKPKKRQLVDQEDMDEEGEEEDEEEEEEEIVSPKGRKKVKNSMNEQQVTSVIQANLAPVTEQLSKMSELITLMAQNQLQKSEPTPEVEATPEVVVAPVETVEKGDNPTDSKIDALTQQIASLVNALSSSTVQTTETIAEVPTAEVAKSEELPVVASNADRPSYTDNPHYSNNAHTPQELNANPQENVVNAMKSMGFIPSSPGARRVSLGLESTQATDVSGDETIELIKSAQDFAEMSFSQINALRTQSGAW